MPSLFDLHRDGRMPNQFAIIAVDGARFRRSGLSEAMAGHVLIYLHKEKELADVVQRFPAEHYVMVDDKLRILAAVKEILCERPSSCGRDTTPWMQSFWQPTRQLT